MDILAVLDLVIGLIFIYFLIGLFCSTIQELISNMLDIRAKDLEGWLKDTFKEDDLGKKLLGHKLIDGLTAKGKRASYIPSDVFSHSLLDLISKSDTGVYTAESLSKTVLTSNLPEDLKRKITQSISEANGDIQKVRKDLETWFNQSMERISGTYKKFAQKMLLIISLLVAGLLNVDSIAIIQYLHTHPEKAAAIADHVSNVVKEAEAQNQKPDSLTTGEKINTNIKDLKKLKSELDKTQIPIGWKYDKVKDNQNERWDWVTKIIGLLMTAMAGVVGAPFWFDMLNKLVNLRSGGKRISTTPDEDEKKIEAKK